MIKHIVSLQSPDFENIRDGKKIIEVRLYDDKRKKIDINDIITFQLASDESQSIETLVTGLLRYNTFENLVSDSPAESFGFDNKKNLLEAIYSFYSKEQEAENGVLGIRIQK